MSVNTGCCVISFNVVLLLLLVELRVDRFSRSLSSVVAFLRRRRRV